ncbi:N-acetylmuramoyl-L-alanine amidase [Sulfurovum sp. bin170]|uniref:N-acetylmuramoyl-L-alanine amidase family protein n=1 Tax=Sulfurovum sp. bin170 TaxID=2695268 RepID=UPI0013DFFEEE|nr:N-acetylmuramoyl-L-alanine amidase [Sulfurovum sp. bin170]NEW60248.1 N-acetylmuramoyl-L-alanine amidase [Sulfurovum sp. bin170]
MNRGLFFILVTVLFSTELWSANSLVDTKLGRNTLELRFKHNIKDTDIKHFVIHAKGFTKYVYDIKNGYLPRGKTLRYSHPDIRAFRIGQYRTNVLRIVIESTKRIKKSHSTSGRVLEIPIPSGKKSYKRSKKYIDKKFTNNIKNRYRVVIDAGHGGRDRGASCCSLHEKKFTLSMAYNLKKRLEKKGYSVYMTRSSDKYISLIERTKYANRKQADIFVSIHVNAAPKRKVKKLKGIEIYYLSKKNVHLKGETITYKGKTVYYKNSVNMMMNKKKISLSRKLGIKVQQGMNRNIRKGYGSLVSKLKRSDFWVLTGTKMPTILVETGYITHKKDRKRLTSSYYRNLAIKGIVDGIDSYFKL